MRNSHLTLVKTSRDPAGLSCSDVRFVHSAFYRGAPTARNFAANEFDPILKWISYSLPQPGQKARLSST